MSTELAVREGASPAPRYEMTVEDLVAQVQKIQQVMAHVMKEETKDSPGHYGVIPGTGTKPTLLKPGAEKLLLLFRLDPEYESVEAYDGAHLTVKSKCVLFHIATGDRVGSGEGLCSTRESKYGYRTGKRACPKCGADAIVKRKADKGGGWICVGNDRGGCWARFAEDDSAITDQVVGRVVNPDLPDQWNTVLKMANKRALIAAVLNATAASDIFTQDLEDLPDVAPASGSGAPTASAPASSSRRPKEAGDDLPKTEKAEDEKSAPITNIERRKLFARAKEKGLDEKDLKDLVYALTQKTSTKEVTSAELDDLVLPAIVDWKKEPETVDGEATEEVE